MIGRWAAAETMVNIERKTGTWEEGKGDGLGEGVIRGGKKGTQSMGGEGNGRTKTRGETYQGNPGSSGGRTTLNATT